MRRDQLGDLMAFMVVAEECSFPRAAARLETSQSTLSHTIRRLESRLGVRLLSRTTRSVAPTEAGERLLKTLRPAFDEIENNLTSLSELREKPAGTIRITSGWHASETVLLPALRKLLPQYPDLRVELMTDQRLVDIVSERFDAGVRLGEQVAQDMIAVPIGPELRMAVVGSPAYFSGRKPPVSPHDLTDHNCINLWLPTRGGPYPWELEQEARELNVRVAGQLSSNDIRIILHAAIDGLGLAYVMEDMALPHIANGKLVRVLEDWCPPFSGYHLYYPSRRQHSPAFALLIEQLRYRSNQARD